VVLFHGYGADANDLAPLADYFSSGNQANWFFPQGTLTVPIGPMMSGRAWFHIDIDALDRALREGATRVLSDKRPGGIDRAADMAAESIAVLRKTSNNIYLGGFSQGAMLATEVFVSGRHNCDKLAILSGTLIDRDNWERQIAAAPRVPIFWSHGQNDPILSFAEAEELRDLFLRYEYPVEAVPFRGGHEIPERVLERMDRWLL
jgi:phospholipase/carboxylesterase